jgi:hypothetical protein
MENISIDAVETLSDQWKVSVFDVVEVCVSDLTRASGEHDEAVEISSGCLRVSGGGLATHHDDLGHGHRWGHRCRARGEVVTCVFCVLSACVHSHQAILLTAAVIASRGAVVDGQSLYLPYHLDHHGSLHDLHESLLHVLRDRDRGLLDPRGLSVRSRGTC